MTMQRFSVRFCVGIALAMFFGSGCSKHPVPPGLPKLYSCVVTITQEGQPVSDATVSLILNDGSRPWAISGSTNASGVATMQTQAHFTGAPAGIYKVCVFKTIQEGTPITIVPAMGESAAVTIIPSFYVVDPKYDRYDTTPLELSIAAKGKTQATFDAGKEVRIRVAD